MTRKDETAAKRQATWRAKRNDMAKNWEQLNVGEQSAVLVLPTNDQQQAIQLLNDWIAKTYTIAGETK